MDLMKRAVSYLVDLFHSADLLGKAALIAAGVSLLPCLFTGVYYVLASEEALVISMGMTMAAALVFSIGWILNSRSQLKALEDQSLRELHDAEIQNAIQIGLLQKQLWALEDDHQRTMLEQWFREIPGLTFHNEIEVEIKFVLPLVKFLGYHEKELRLRVPVQLQVGRQSIKGEADWMIRNRDTGEPQIVIEAKGPNQPLDEEAIAQTRSYAFGLSAPIYALTNGERLLVYHRGVLSDFRTVDCATKDLATSWSSILGVMGAARATGQSGD